MLRSMRWPVGICCILALCLAAVSGFAAPAPSAAVGVVDLDQVANSYIGYQRAMQRLDTYMKERAGRFDALKTGVGLNADDFSEYQRLAGGGVPINPARIGELEALAAGNLAELKALRAQESCSGEEQARLDQLEQDLKAVSARINETGAKLTKEIDAEQARYTEILIDLMNAAIEKVAESKKLTVVLSRAAQVGNGSERLVLWGGTDITDDVTKLLNQEFKDSLLDAE